MKSYIILLKSRDNTYLGGGEIFIRPHDKSIGAYQWQTSIKNPLAYKKVRKKVTKPLCFWTRNKVGANKKYREFFNLNEAIDYIVFQNTNMNLFLMLEYDT